jgi:hypothetical protein
MDFYSIVQLLVYKESDKAEDITTLIAVFEKEGNANIKAV